MNIDEELYKLPVIGSAYRQMHAYFRTQITLTDIIHVLVGVGVGMIIVDKKLGILETLIILLGIVYHLYAFIEGKKL